MCTVTFVARRMGYALGMNRDEKLSRPLGLPPRRLQWGRRSILAPGDPAGGTWIGVNQSGATFALLNWYAVSARVTGQTVSRGEVVQSALPSDAPAAADAFLDELPLHRVNPFRLLGVFPACETVVEWRWNLARMERIRHGWRTNSWSSSGFDEPGARNTRSRVFKEAWRQATAGSTAWLRRLHRSHGPECGPYSTCMHRDDAATVSYTEVVVSRRLARLVYIPGAPCRTVPVRPLRLPLSS